MENSLSDTNTCIVLSRDLINKVLTELKNMLKRWKHHKYISDSAYSHLNNSNAILPLAYGLSKLHKPGNPLRIISSINSP